MSTTTVPHAPANGNGSVSPSLTAVHVGTLSEEIDRLAELRATRQRIEQDERALTASVVGAMTKLGLPAFRATRALATLGERTNLTVDPELFVAAVGTPRVYQAMTVSVENARRLLGSDELSAISERTATPVLRIDALPAASGRGASDDDAHHAAREAV